MKQKVIQSRLYSLDALRGFDMFWIIGGEEIFHALAKATHAPFWEWLSLQFTHPLWHGFRIYDLIFPLFLFISGVATPYSVGREIENGVKKNKLLLRVIKRGMLLVLFGIIYNNGLILKPLAEIRFPSVLGRIGLAYMFANIIYLYTNQRGQIISFVILLLGYWALLMGTSAPGFATGDLSMEGNFASYIDRMVLPGHLHRIIHDPEGLVSLIPAIATGLLGIFAGNILQAENYSQIQKTKRMVLIGIIFLILAQIWNIVFPINKNLWTSSFVLHTGGLSLLLLALFYYIIDVKGHKRWAFFFSVIGMNSILIYMSDRFIDWEFTAKAFLSWIAQMVDEHYGIVIFAIGIVLIKWLFLYFLYLKKTFLKV